jgi:hypothetical protein
MTSELPDNEMMFRRVAEANDRAAAAKAPRQFEGRPLLDEGLQNPYYGCTAGYGVIIVRFADGAVGVRAYPHGDTAGPGWACDVPARAGGLSHLDLLKAFTKQGPSARAAKLRWLPIAGGGRALALVVGKYRGAQYDTVEKRKTFRTVVEQFVMEPVDASRAATFAAFGARLAILRIERHLAGGGGPAFGGGGSSVSMPPELLAALLAAHRSSS